VVSRIRDDYRIAQTAFRESKFFRTLVQLTLAFVFFYFFLPWDLIPDELGLIGYVDDIAIILVGFWLLYLLAEWYREKLLQEISARNEH